VPVDEPPGPATGQVPPDDGPGGAVGADSVEERDESDGSGSEQAAVRAEPDDLALRRALADLDNLRKRYERELGRARSVERAAVAGEWLSIVDDLERALDHSSEEDLALLDGVRAVHDQAVALLARLGFPRFEDLGKPFDPSRHEAMGVVDGNGASGTVAAIVRPGYDGPGQVLRPAGVVVTRGA
jgi:molecular chaperone GrpE